MMFKSVQLKTAFFMVSILFIVSCNQYKYSPPKEYSFKKEAVLSLDYEAVCERINSFFEYIGK